MISRNKTLPVQRAVLKTLNKSKRDANLLLRSESIIRSAVAGKPECVYKECEQLLSDDRRNRQSERVRNEMDAALHVLQKDYEEDAALFSRTIVDFMKDELLGLREHLSRGNAPTTWNDMLYEECKCRLVMLETYVRSVGTVDFSPHVHESLDELAQNLFCANLLLFYSSFEGQMNEHMVELSENQAAINRSMLILTILSILISFIAVSVSVSALNSSNISSQELISTVREASRQLLVAIQGCR